MKTVDFYKLPRAIQDRFVGSVMSGFPPAPLLVVKGGTPTKFLWLGVSFVAFVLLVVVARVGYGGLESGAALHSFKVLPIYALLVFGVAFGLVQAFACLVRERAMPYTAGIYLFPACLIDARHDQFKIYETRDLANVDVQGGAIRLSFAGGVQFLFPMVEASRGAEIVAEVQASRDRAMHAHATEDLGELVAVDPLHNPRFSSPVGPREPYGMKLPAWGSLGWAVGLAVAIVLGPSLWALRNNGSDKKMYALATQADESVSYRAYLERGRKFKDEIGDILLPRAELRDAEREGTVEALLKYKTEHPGSKIAPEVNRALRAAMLSELDKAKAPGTLAALQDFAKRYPDHGVDPELKAAVHAVYARELEAYKKRAPTKDKNATAFVERLFAWAEKNGPKIEVRFRRKASQSLERADQHILKTPNFMGVVTYPSRFFDDKHAIVREQAFGKILTTQIQAGLTPELFEVGSGANGPADNDVLPEVKAPTLFVSHVAEWSGHTYNSNRPRGTFIGIQFNFDASFVIPGDAKPYKTTAQVFRHAALNVLHEDDSLPAPGAAEEKVYNAMADDALDKFTRQILAAFFKEKDKAAP